MADADGGEKVPERLRRLVERDRRPVRPLRSPLLRASLLVPAAVIVLLTVPAVLGIREDVVLLGVSLSWGVSAVQMLVGILLVGLALQESVPGRALSGRVLAASIAAGLAVVLAVTLVTAVASPSVMPGRLRAYFFGYCLSHSALVGAPLVLIAGFLAARAYPLRPLVAGALYGLGAGLMADAGWRLFCEVSAPWHVLTAHGGAILVLVALGIVGAEAGERARSWLRRHPRILDT